MIPLTTRSRPSCAAAYLLAVTSLLPCLPARAADPALPPPTAPEVKSEQATATLRRLSQSANLQFTTSGNPAHRRFHFVFRLSSEPRGGEPQYTDFVVVRDGDRVGILVRSPDGLPLAYLTEGFMVVVDRATKSGFVTYNRGAPSFVLRAAREEGNLDFVVAHAGRAERGNVDVDLASLLRGGEPQFRKAVLDRTTGTLMATTDRTALMVTLPAITRPGGFDVRSFVLRTNTGKTLAFLDPAVGVEPPFDPAKANPEAVAKLKLPVRVMEEAERAALSLVVPADFGRDDKEREAATRLSELLMPPTKVGAGGGKP